MTPYVQLTSPLLSQAIAQNGAKLIKMFNNNIKHYTSKWIRLWEGCVMVALSSKLELQGFLWRKFYRQRTCVPNPMPLTPTQPKIQTLKVKYFVLPYTNEYAKEKEKKTTFFTKCHRELLNVMIIYLFNNMVASILSHLLKPIFCIGQFLRQLVASYLLFNSKHSIGCLCKYLMVILHLTLLGCMTHYCESCYHEFWLFR